MKRILCILFALPLLAQPPAPRPKPTNVKVGSTTAPARTVEFVPGTGTTYSLSCADGTCSLTINYTGGPPDVVNFTGASRTAPVKTGTTPPATCTVGDWFFKTNAVAGQNIALCTAANTWTYLESAFATLSGAQLTLPSITAYTVATLPAAGVAGRLAVVTDAVTAGNCTNGGGANIALCRDNGSAWLPLGDGGSGGGGSSNSYIQMPAANCQYGAAATGFAIDTDGPQTVCIEGTNVKLGVLRFSNSAAQYVQTTLRLEGIFTRIDLSGLWRTTATSGNVVWQVQTACIENEGSIDPAWSSAQTIVDAASSTAGAANLFSLSGVTACSPGQLMAVRFFRDPAHQSDTINADADLINLVWTVVR